MGMQIRGADGRLYTIVNDGAVEAQVTEAASAQAPVLSGYAGADHVSGNWVAEP